MRTPGWPGVKSPAEPEIEPQPAASRARAAVGEDEQPARHPFSFSLPGGAHGRRAGRVLDRAGDPRRRGCRRSARRRRSRARAAAPGGPSAGPTATPGLACLKVPQLTVSPGSVVKAGKTSPNSSEASSVAVDVEVDQHGFRHVALVEQFLAFAGRARIGGAAARRVGDQRPRRPRHVHRAAQPSLADGRAGRDRQHRGDAVEPVAAEVAFAGPDPAFGQPHRAAAGDRRRLRVGQRPVADPFELRRAAPRPFGRQQRRGDGRDQPDRDHRHRPPRRPSLQGLLHDAPGRIRTCGLRLRRAALYPAELRALGQPALSSRAMDLSVTFPRHGRRRCPRRGAPPRACWSRAGANGCCSTAARGPSASCSARWA